MVTSQDNSTDTDEELVYEDQEEESTPDTASTPTRSRRLVTNPYDTGIKSLIAQIEDKTIHLRPLGDRPRFQRRYVWSDTLASRLIESILLNIPIPPCYLSQNDDFEMDVIDGQQRIFSLYRFVNNHFPLSSLEILTEINGKRFHQLESRLQRQIETHTLRCIVIQPDSDPDIRFDVFERLNTYTVPLNAQELRNCIYRGTLVDLLADLAEYEPWLRILGREKPDKRMRGEELILRFFTFQIQGLSTYRTPLKYWLNDAAEAGRGYPQQKINELERAWKDTLDKCLRVFAHDECFRRLPLGSRRAVVNRALFDLTMTSMARIPEAKVATITSVFRDRYLEVLEDPTFDDLITRAIDHKTRTTRRFEIWAEKVTSGLF